MVGQVRDALIEGGIDFGKINEPKTFLVFDHPSLEFEMDILRFIFAPIDKPMRIFLQTHDGKTENYRTLFETTKIQLFFFNEIMTVNSQSIDAIFNLSSGYGKQITGLTSPYMQYLEAQWHFYDSSTNHKPR